ncbi:MAG: 4'-phosphopantetheinyl transferase superfamily protein [Verrucomicrobiota bacterium]
MPHFDDVEPLHEALLCCLPDTISGAVNLIGERAAFDFPDEATLREKAGPGRKQEFITGRRCARAALAQLGQAAGAILADEQGAPLWPKDFVGSISHSKGFCAAIVAGSEHFRALGLDLEQTNRLRPSAHKHVVHPREMLFVDEEQVRATLLFSLKEAFYKLQFPLFAAQPGFQDVHFEVDLSGGSAAIAGITETFSESLQEAVAEMRFAFAFTEVQVVTVAML